MYCVLIITWYGIEIGGIEVGGYTFSLTAAMVTLIASLSFYQCITTILDTLPVCDRRP